MRDHIRVGYLGLGDRELRILRSMFSLAPQFSENYTLSDPTALSTTDVVLVNTDDASAFDQWNAMARRNTLAVPIMLSSNGKAAGNAVSMPMPIQLPTLIAAVERATRTKLVTPGSDAVANLPLKILVVDDSLPVRTYLEQKLPGLNQAPTQLSFAVDGEQAQQRVAEDEFDLVFLDVVMPGIDGYKVCKEIKAKYSSYVVMLTSKKSPFDKVRGAMSGCDGYVTKPPSDERLSLELQKCIKKRSKEKQQWKMVAGDFG